MAESLFAKITQGFASNVGSVTDLMHFDAVVLEFAMHSVTAIDQRLGHLHPNTGPRLAVSNALTALKNVRQNESMRKHYAQMLNQCDVLLVSYFSAAIADVFRVSVSEALRKAALPAVLKEEIKVSLRDIREMGGDLTEHAGDLLASHRDISFLDMQSIARAFGQYFGHEPIRDAITNDIITSQACRHVIVHSGGVVDRKMLGQLRSAVPRTLKQIVTQGERVQFSEAEVLLVAEQMTRYLEELVASLSRVLGEAPPGRE